MGGLGALAGAALGGAAFAGAAGGFQSSPVAALYSAFSASNVATCKDNFTQNVDRGKDYVVREAKSPRVE